MIDLSREPVRTITKAMQTQSNRMKHTQKQLGMIRNKYRKKVNHRSQDYCEGCQRHKLSCMTLENAHIDGRGTIDHLTTDHDLLRLCGPSTESGTCHHWVHSSEDGKAWMVEQQKRLREGLNPLPHGIKGK